MRIPNYLWLLLATAILLVLTNCATKHIPDNLPNYRSGPGWSYFEPSPGYFIIITDDVGPGDTEILDRIMEEELRCGPCIFDWRGSGWHVEVIQ